MEEPEAPNELSKEKKSKGKGKETLFRVAYRNQISLIQIADNKANLIISINTMIISTIIAVSGYGVIAEKLAYNKSYVLVPIIIIVLSCLISAILAIQAARPKIIRGTNWADQEQKSSLLFFGLISRLSQQVYLQRMKELVASDQDVYETMTIDLYNQGIILSRKYKLLSYAFGIFMIGFVSSVLIFVSFLLFGSV